MNTQLTREEIAEKLDHRVLARVARDTELSHVTIRKLVDPKSSVNKSTLRIVSDYLKGGE